METSSLRTLKIMPRNLNELVQSWIRLQVTYQKGQVADLCTWNTVRMYSCSSQDRRTVRLSGGWWGGRGRGGEAGNPGRGRSKQTRAERVHAHVYAGPDWPAASPYLPGSEGGEGLIYEAIKICLYQIPHPSSPSQRGFSKKLVMKYLAQSAVITCKTFKRGRL
jgi:hypothetical protein